MTVHWKWVWKRGANADAAEPAAPGLSEMAKKDLELRSTGFEKFLDKSYDTAGSSVERYRAAATLVQTMATALGALYTGALALVFGEDKGGLPARGLLTPAFFAIALVFALLYSAALSPRWKRPARPPLWSGAAERNLYEQLRAYRLDIAELVTRNIWALHAAVLSLGVAVAFAPAPFVRDPGLEVTLTPWPTSPGTGDAALELYKAQIAETATVRAGELSSSGPFFSTQWDRPWIIAAIVALLAVVLWSLLVGIRVRRKFSAVDGQSDQDPPASAPPGSGGRRTSS